MIFKKETKMSCRVPIYEGQSIIEVVVSIAIAAILAISLISTMLVTQKTSRAAKNNSEATKLAQEYIEQLRIFRDRNGFDALQPDDCLLDTSGDNPSLWEIRQTLGNSCYVSSVVDDTIFKRRFEIVDEDASDDLILVTVTVTWDDADGEKSVVNSTFLRRLQ